MQILLTIIAGVSVFILGQIALKTFIEPIQEQRRIVGRIAHAITFFRDVTVDGATIEKITKEQRQMKVDAVRNILLGLAAELRATRSVLPFYRLFADCHVVLSDDDMQKLTLPLMRWALFMSDHAAEGAVQVIGSILKLPYIQKDWDEFLAMMKNAPQKHADEP